MRARLSSEAAITIAKTVTQSSREDDEGQRRLVGVAKLVSRVIGEGHTERFEQLESFLDLGCGCCHLKQEGCALVLSSTGPENELPSGARQIRGRVRGVSTDECYDVLVRTQSDPPQHTAWPKH